MKNLSIDEPLLKQLEHCSQPVNLCDSRGVLIGRFFPALDPSQYEPVTPLSPEELDRRMKSTEWLTTEEVLSRLEQL